MMKTIICSIVFINSVCIVALGQSQHLSTFFEKYSSDESFSHITISSKMFDLFTNLKVDDPEDQQALEAISKLNGLHILTKEKASNSKALYNEVLSTIKPKGYEVLLNMRDKDSNMKFLIHEAKSGVIDELIMIKEGEDGFMLLSLFGEINLQQISQIGDKMDIDGLKNLKKIHEKRN